MNDAQATELLNMTQLMYDELRMIRYQLQQGGGTAPAAASGDLTPLASCSAVYASNGEEMTDEEGRKIYQYSLPDGRALSDLPGVPCKFCGGTIRWVAMNRRDGTGRFSIPVNDNGYRHRCDRGSTAPSGASSASEKPAPPADDPGYTSEVPF